MHVGAAATILDRLGVNHDKVREMNARLFEPAFITDGSGHAESSETERPNRPSPRHGE